MNDKVRAFIEAYLDEQYVPSKIAKREKLAQAAMLTCKQRLKTAGIMAFCKCRAKTRDSTRAKLEKLWRRGDWKTLDELKRLEYLDLVGVRICLYFLSQARAVQELLQSEPSFHIVQVRGFGSLDDADSDVDADRSVRSCLGKTGAYDAKHFWMDVSCKEAVTLQHDLGVAGSRVEIQVRSAFMEAWAEMQHDLAYKMVPESPGDEESSILRCIKKTSALCETMAEQLRIVREGRSNSERRQSKI